MHLRKKVISFFFLFSINFLTRNQSYNHFSPHDFFQSPEKNQDFKKQWPPEGDKYQTLSMFVFTQPLYKNQNVTQDQFFRGVQLVWIQSFPSPRPVAISRLKNPICPTIYLSLGGENSQEHCSYVKCKQPHPGFELESLDPKQLSVTSLKSHGKGKFSASYNFKKSYIQQCNPIYPTPPLGQDMTQGQFLKQSLAGLNSEFSFS